jgi:hypothetical protein
MCTSSKQHLEISLATKIAVPRDKNLEQISQECINRRKADGEKTERAIEHKRNHTRMQTEKISEESSDEEGDI